MLLQEALGTEGIGVGKVVCVVADGVLTYRYIVACGDMLVLNDDTARRGFSPQSTRSRGSEAQGFLEASTEVVAGTQEGPLVY